MEGILMTMPSPLILLPERWERLRIRGQVTSVEAREIRNEKTIYMFNVTDFTDTITVKMFLHNEQVPEISGAIKKGAFLKLKGVTTIDKFDHEITIGSLAGIGKSVFYHQPDG